MEESQSRMKSKRKISNNLLILIQSEFLGNEKSKPILIGNSISLITLVVSMVVLGINFGIVGLSVSLVIANLFKVLTFLFFKKKQEIDNATK